MESAYEHIVGAFPLELGKACSKRERGMKNMTNDKSLVYGEISFQTMKSILQKIKDVYGKPNAGTCDNNGIIQKAGGRFYDLGSGVGKQVIAAAIVHNFDTCIGIEILEGLYNISLEVLNSYTTRGRIHPYLISREKPTECQFIHCDMLNMDICDWRDGDVVFINSTCFNEEQLEVIAELAQGMRKGSFFVSLTRRLAIGEFVVMEYFTHPTNWGDVSVFIMQKITDINERLINKL